MLQFSNDRTGMRCVGSHSANVSLAILLFRLPRTKSDMLTPARPSPSEPSRAFSRGWSPAFGHMLGRSPDTGRAGLLNSAEIVVWQASRRLIIAGGLGAISIALRLVHLVVGSRLANSHHRAGVHRRHRGAHGRHRPATARDARGTDRAVARRRRRDFHDDVARDRAGDSIRAHCSSACSRCSSRSCSSAARRR